MPTFSRLVLRHARRVRSGLILRAFAVPLVLISAASFGAASAQAATAAPAATTSAAQARPHAAPRTAVASSPGTNIGNAGVLTSAAKGTGTIVSGSDDWWVIYPGTVGGVVTVKVTNSTSSSCTIEARLDGTDGADQLVQTILVNAGTSNELAGTASGSDRYYVEVTSDGCSGPAPYTLTLVSGGGGMPPNPAAGSVPAGTSIADAWPPLQGHTYYTAALASTQNSDWYVLYKKPDTTAATIRVQNTTSGCALEFSLLNTFGAGGDVQNAVVSGDAAATFTIPGQETQDPQGRYFMTVSSDGCGGAGEPYSMEPEPAAEWQSPAKVPAGHVAAGTSAANAWPPLHGNAVYGEVLGSTQNADWYLLYKKPDSTLATIRFENTANGCTLDFILYGSTGAGKLGAQLQSALISGDAAATATVAAKEATDPLGRYFVAVSSDGCAGAGEPYSIQPEPGTQWEAPALKVTTTTLKKGTVNKAYSATIGVSEGKTPYTFTAKAALPPGLSIGTTTGVISGTPTKAGRYTFPVQITDSTKPTSKSVTYTFSITIAS